MDDSPWEQKTIASDPYVFTARPRPAACWAWFETQEETFWMWISGFAKWFDMCRPPEATSSLFDIPFSRISSADNPPARHVVRSR